MQQIAEACDAIIEASPADERALYIRRLVAQRTDDAQGFANVVEKIDVGKLNAEEAATLAMLLLDDTDFRYRHVKVAAGCARRALEQAPESSLSRQAYAEVLYAAGKLEAAVKWLEKAAQDPEADPIVKLKLAHLKAIVELAKGLE
jgi:predicted Zn-dependent protease